MNEALALVRRLNHVYALASVLLYACWMEWIASSPPEAERFASELVALSDANGYPDVGLGTVPPWVVPDSAWTSTRGERPPPRPNILAPL